MKAEEATTRLRELEKENALYGYTEVESLLSRIPTANLSLVGGDPTSFQRLETCE